MGAMKPQAGHTLLELTTVLAIVGTLSAFALPRYADAMRSARVAKMASAQRAVKTSVRLYHMKWVLAGAPAAPSMLDDVHMNAAGYPTNEGIVVAAGLAEDYDTRVAGIIAADAQHPLCSLAYTPANGHSRLVHADGLNC